MTDTIVIRLTGDSGDGVQLVGEQLTITAALAGKEVRTLPDFPAEIRAPLGTVAGVSGFQLAMAEKAIFTAGETLDVLVALNPAALKNALGYLNEGGLLIVNEDSLSLRDWEKAGASPDLLKHASEHYQVISVPLITNTLRALEGLDLTQPQAKKAKNFYVLGLVLWLFDFSTEIVASFIEKKFKQKPMLIEANIRALKAGYNHAMTLELSRQTYTMGSVEREKGDYRQITGVEAISLAIATLATRLKLPVLVSGYPITPASAILHECAKLSEFGVQLFQAEDEIAAICACLGAAYGGSLAFTCTSGPGLDLKSEALGLAVATELPLVVLDVQRAGVSTGMPTKTGQSDLRQALYGRHGEAPLPVFAASSPVDCFTTMIEAMSVAVKFMTPVIVLLDAYLVNAAEPWCIPEPEAIPMPEIQFNRFPKPYMRDEVLSRSWTIPGSPGLVHHLGGLEKQGDEGKISYDAKNHEEMVHLRAQKILNVSQCYAPLELEGDQDAEILLVGWGSTEGALRGVLAAAKERHLSLALLQLRHLNPLPQDLGQILRQFKHVFVAELNSGQLCQLLRAEYLVNAQKISQCNGLPLTVSVVLDALESKVNHGKISVYA
jgi:2-oxoglutarate/2-oxoacid ferredoxin oxidoreductase subunit alpha